MTEIGLNDLKKLYAELSKKHKLPGFEELNNSFEIEKIDIESDNLIRVLRKVMMEKIVNAMGFFEMLLNPVNAPRMYFAYIKAMTEEDKGKIDKIYEKLAEISTEALELEVEYSEKGEGAMVKKIFDSWNAMKPDLKIVFSHIKNPEALKDKKEKSYFG